MGKKHQIHAISSKRNKIPKPTYEVNHQGDTLVPLRGEMLVRYIPAKKQMMVCKKCGIPFWSVDNERLYCIACSSWVSAEGGRRRQKIRQANRSHRKQSRKR